MFDIGPLTAPARGLILPFSLSVPTPSVPSASVPAVGFTVGSVPTVGPSTAGLLVPGLTVENACNRGVCPEMTGAALAPGLPVASRPFASVWSEAMGRERTTEPEGESREQDNATDASLNTAALAAMLAMKPVASRQLQIVMYPDSSAVDIRTEPAAAKNKDSANAEMLNDALVNVPAITGQTLHPQEQMSIASALPEATAAKPEQVRGAAQALTPPVVRQENRVHGLHTETGLQPEVDALPQYVPTQGRSQVLTDTADLTARARPSKPLAGEVPFTLSGRSGMAAATILANTASPEGPSGATAAPYSEARAVTPKRELAPVLVTEHTATATRTEKLQSSARFVYSPGIQPDSLLPQYEIPLPARDWQSPEVRQEQQAQDAVPAENPLLSALDDILPVGGMEWTPPAEVADTSPDPLVAPAPQTDAPQQNAGAPGDKILSLDLFATETGDSDQKTGLSDGVASGVLIRASGAQPSAAPLNDGERAPGSRREAATDEVDANTVTTANSAYPAVTAELSTETAEKPQEAAQLRPVVMQPLQDDSPLQRSGEARHIAVDVRGEDGSVVQVRFSATEAGQLQLNVHSNDEILSREFRAGAADLITRLEDQGFEVRPADTSSPDANADTNDQRRRKQTAPEEEEISAPKRNHGPAYSAFEVQRT